MTSKTTTKPTRKNSLQQSRKNSRKHSLKKSRRISRQRQLQKQLQMLALERHSRKCIICHHPEREAIEEEFLHWRAPWKLAEDYNLADYRTLYRHARAAGLLLQRRENLHSALDAFVEAVDDVKFTPDTILRAMRAYSCIDRHGRWTEIPTQVHISTFHDVDPGQSPAPYPKNGSSVIDIEPEQLEEDTEDDPDDDDPDNDAPADDPDDTPDDNNDPKNESEADSLEENTACAASPAQSVSTGSSNSLYSGRTVTATACAVSSAQAFNVSNSDADFDGDPGDEPDENATESGEHNEDSKAEALPQGAPQHPPGRSPTITTLAVSSKLASRSDATACAVPPAQAVSGVRLNSNHRGRSETATACAGLPRPSRGSPAQALPRDAVRGQNLKDRSPSGRTACATSLVQPVSAVSLSSDDRGRNVTATACAVSSAQAPPRNAVRGPNPKDRSPSDRTDCAASPAQNDGAAPRK
jgi:hypothetical protein